MLVHVCGAALRMATAILRLFSSFTSTVSYASAIASNFLRTHSSTATTNFFRAGFFRNAAPMSQAVLFGPPARMVMILLVWGMCYVSEHLF